MKASLNTLDPVMTRSTKLEKFHFDEPEDFITWGLAELTPEPKF
jgi:hypothetical protein